jgi:hypothetical protein
MTVRTRDGYLVPELAAILIGTREADRLAEHGLTLDRDQVNLTELGRAVIEHEPMPDPTTLAPLLDRLRDQNQTTRRDLETAPERLNRMVSEANDVPPKRGLDHGHPDSERRAQPKGRDRKMTIEDFLKESHDKHEEWS